MLTSKNDYVKKSIVNITFKHSSAVANHLESVKATTQVDLRNNLPHNGNKDEESKIDLEQVLSKYTASCTKKIAKYRETYTPQYLSNKSGVYFNFICGVEPRHPISTVCAITDTGIIYNDTASLNSNESQIFCNKSQHFHSSLALFSATQSAIPGLFGGASPLIYSANENEFILKLQLLQIVDKEFEFTTTFISNPDKLRELETIK